MPWYSFLHVYFARVSLRFLGIRIYSFHQNLKKVFGHYFFKHFFCSTLFLLSFRDSNYTHSRPLESQSSLTCFFFFFFFLPHLWYAEVTGPGIEPIAQLQPGPQKWQCQILNLLCHQGTLTCFLFRWILSVHFGQVAIFRFTSLFFCNV